MSKKSSGAAPHPTKSFQTLVAEEGNRLAKQIIEPLVVDYVTNAAQQVKQQLAYSTIRTLAEIKTRMGALEKILISKGLFSDTELSEAILDIEDDALGYSKVETASEGDTLRVSSRSGADAASLGLPTNVLIAKLGANKSFPTEVETALLGKKAGDKVQVSSETKTKDKDGNETSSTTTYEVTVIRVSRKKETESAKS